MSTAPKTPEGERLARWLNKEPGATMPGTAGTTSSGSPEEHGVYEIPAEDIDDDFDEGWHPVEIVTWKIAAAKKSGDDQFILSTRCFAGPMRGRYKTDYLPLKGRGVAKTAKFAEAVELRDHDTGAVKLVGALLPGKRYWVKFSPVTRTYKDANDQDQTSTRNEIDFRGYAHISKMQLPEEGDFFAEPGNPTPAEPVVPKPTAAPTPKAEAPTAPPAAAPPSSAAVPPVAEPVAAAAGEPTAPPAW